TQMTVTILASLLKVPGTYPIQLSDGTNTSGTSPFIVGDAVEAPAVTTIDPPEGTQGTTVNVNITGTNLTGASEVVFNGADVTGTIGAGGSSTTVPVSIKIGANANTGARNITVTATGGKSK